MRTNHDKSHKITEAKNGLYGFLIENEIILNFFVSWGFLRVLNVEFVIFWGDITRVKTIEHRSSDHDRGQNVPGLGIFCFEIDSFRHVTIND